MFDFLARLGGSKNQPAEKSQPSAKATEARPKYYQPERYYMRGPGPAWHAAHPNADKPLAARSSEARSVTSDER